MLLTNESLLLYLLCFQDFVMDCPEKTAMVEQCLFSAGQCLSQSGNNAKGMRRAWKGVFMERLL
jgi:hypothetical protein